MYLPKADYLNRMTAFGKRLLRKMVLVCALFALSAAGISALDTQSGNFMEYLLGLNGPSAPEVFEDAVIFTAPSGYRSVGVAFASENFAKIHRFVKLMVPIDDTAEFDPASKVPPEMLRDSGLLFYAYVPENPSGEIEYRLIIDGLWSADPVNRRKKADPVTGLELSVTDAPPPKRATSRADAETKTLTLCYRAESGEIVTVAGDFNGWDPFMYRLKEESPGFYSVSLPLPAGTWRYVFFHRGRRVPDPDNLNRVYSRNGTVVNVIELR